MFPKTLFLSLFLITYLFSFTTSFRDLPMGTNSSTSQLQARQPVYPTLHCGTKFKLISFRAQSNFRTCTLGFAVKRVRGDNRWRFDYGYLSLASCLSAVPGRRAGHWEHDVSVLSLRRIPAEVVVGRTSSARLNSNYQPLEGLDYVILEITRLQVWDNLWSMSIATNDFNQPALIATLASVTPAKGTPVCYSSAYSGLICGELVFTDNEFTRYNPWRNYQVDYFFRVSVVGLKFPPLPLNLNSERRADYGAPVFVPVYNQCQEPKQIIAAHPVGLFLDYSLMPFVIPRFWPDPQLQLIPFSFYYVPLGRILENEPDLDLLTSPRQPNLAERGCNLRQN